VLVAALVILMSGASAQEALAVVLLSKAVPIQSSGMSLQIFSKQLPEAPIRLAQTSLDLAALSALPTPLQFPSVKPVREVAVSGLPSADSAQKTAVSIPEALRTEAAQLSQSLEAGEGASLLHRIYDGAGPRQTPETAAAASVRESRGADLLNKIRSRAYISNAWKILRPGLGDGQHVAAFGSWSSDIIELFSLAPKATHFHNYDIIDFADTFHKGTLIEDLQANIAELAGGGKVEIVDRGFLEAVPPDVLKAHDYSDDWFTVNVRKDPRLRKPLIYKVDLPLPDGGNVTRYVYLHVLDFNDESLVAEAMGPFQGDSQLQLALWNANSMLPSNAKPLNMIAKTLSRAGGALVINHQPREVELKDKTSPLEMLFPFEDLSRFDYSTVIRDVTSQGRYALTLKEVFTRAGLKPASLTSNSYFIPPSVNPQRPPQERISIVLSLKER
jgi:hypothetical protein